jgi:hypothetical protein
MGCALLGKRITPQNTNVYFRKRFLQRASERYVSQLGIIAWIFFLCQHVPYYVGISYGPNLGVLYVVDYF